MKKILIKLFVIILVLAVITGGVLLIKVGINTFNTNNTSTTEGEKEKEEEKDLSLENFEEELVVAKEKINNKIEELERLENEKQIECDKLEAEEKEAFFDDSNGDRYYECRRKHDKCYEELLNFENKIYALKIEGTFFTTDDEIKQLINNKKEIENKIDKIKNPDKSFEIFSRSKKEVNKNKVIGVAEIIGGILIILIQILSIIGIYNKVVKSLHKVRKDFANIDVYLKKRWELIPNIVESVKGYAAHESDTFKDITKLRSINYKNMSLNEKVNINNEISNAISKIMILKEDYPDLKANNNFLNLSSELSEIEDDIANSRINYNNSVMKYNNIIKVFPNNLFVNFFKYDEIEMFKISSEEKENVEIKI